MVLFTGCNKCGSTYGDSSDALKTSTAVSPTTVDESTARDIFVRFVNSKIGKQTAADQYGIKKLIVDVDQIDVRPTGLSDVPYRASAKVWSRSAGIPNQKLGSVTMVFEYKNDRWGFVVARDSSVEMKYRTAEIEFFKQ